MRRTVQLLAAGILLLIPYQIVHADSIRGRLAGSVIIDGEESLSFQLDDLIGISLEDGISNLLGIEIELSVPPQVRRYRDSFLLYIYKSLDPAPSESTVSYYGEEVLSSVLPSVSKYYIRIPLTEDAKLTAPPGTYLADKAMDPVQFPLLITVLPVMKGIPPSVYQSTFGIKTRALYLPRGAIELKLVDKSRGEPVDPKIVTVSIDNTPIEYPADQYEVASGIHVVSVASSQYEDSHVRIVVEEGKKHPVEITLENSYSQFQLEAPEMAQVFIDGEKHDFALGSSQKIRPGEHTFTVKLGEYSMSKKIEFLEGKSYNISLFFDIFIKEN